MAFVLQQRKLRIFLSNRCKLITTFSSIRLTNWQLSLLKYKRNLKKRQIYRNKTKFAEFIRWKRILYSSIWLERSLYFIAYFYICYFCLRWKSWKRKMTAYPILIFMQSLIKFQSVVPEIQMKRAKRDIHTYLHTYLLTNQVIE